MKRSLFVCVRLLGHFAIHIGLQWPALALTRCDHLLKRTSVRPLAPHRSQPILARPLSLGCHLAYQCLLEDDLKQPRPVSCCQRASTRLPLLLSFISRLTFQVNCVCTVVDVKTAHDSSKRLTDPLVYCHSQRVKN